MIKNRFFYLLFVLLIGCSAKKNETVEFIILSINDVYEIDALEGGSIGGLARVETLHKKLLKENKNTFLVHAGDFLNPSLLGTMRDKNGDRYRGKQMIDVMNAMNFDLVAFGNHEFDLKEKDFQNRLNESNFQWIATNVQHSDHKELSAFCVEKQGVKREIPKTVVFDIDDVHGNKIKLGFFSATINSTPNIYVDYGDFYQDAIHAYKTLEPKTDLIFGLTHLTLNQDKLLAKSIPKTTLIIGGHEHTNMLVPVGNVLISKADSNAKTAYVHRITYNTTTKEVKINSELITMDSKIEEDKEVSKLIRKWNVQLDKKLNQILENPYEVIFNTTTSLDGRDKEIRSKQTNLGQLIAESMYNAFDGKVDCAFVNSGSIRIDDELEGAITGVDIFRVLPFGGGVYKVDMTGELLEKVLNYSRLKTGTGAYLQYYNTQYNATNKKFSISNKEIISSKIYTVIVSDYLLKGFDIPFLKSDANGVVKVYKNNSDHSSNDIRKVVIDFLKKV